jgi:hypothetical protein
LLAVLAELLVGLGVLQVELLGPHSFLRGGVGSGQGLHGQHGGGAHEVGAHEEVGAGAAATGPGVTCAGGSETAGCGTRRGLGDGGGTVGAGTVADAWTRPLGAGLAGAAAVGDGAA